MSGFVLTTHIGKRRAGIALLAGLLSVLYLGSTPHEAGAPPPSFPVEGQIEVTEPCVVYGHEINFEGTGFAPDTPVHVFAEQGHHSLPGGLPGTRVRSDRAGDITGSLSAIKEGGEKWTQLAIVATGLDRGGRHRGRSFDLVVVGRTSICRELGSQ